MMRGPTPGARHRGPGTGGPTPGGTPALRQKSTRQRREAVAHDVYRAVCDVERMNIPNDPQLNFYLEFTDDVAELHAAEADRGDDDAAAI
jgi:hypothetical protein